jgi:hypothetical protein
MSEPVRVREEDHDAITAVQEVLGLPFPEVVHLGLTTDVLDGSPAQNARRAIQYNDTYVLEQYDDVHDVPVDDITPDGADQATAGLTIGAQKREHRREKTE